MDSTFFPLSEVAKSIAFLLSALKPLFKEPPVKSLITPEPGLSFVVPEFRYDATAKPEAIPVIEGWGIAGFLRYVLRLATVFLLVPGERRLVARFGEVPRLRETEDLYDFSEINLPLRKYIVLPLAPFLV